MKEMASPSTKLNLSHLPPVYILPTHLQTDDLHKAEDALYHAGGRLTYRAGEARIFLSRVLRKKRAAFDLRTCGVWTKEEPLPVLTPGTKWHTPDLDVGELPAQPSSSESGGSSGSEHQSASASRRKRKRIADPQEPLLPNLSNHAAVLSLDWLEACRRSDAVIEFGTYLIYCGKIIEKPASDEQATSSTDGITYITAIPETQIQSPAVSDGLLPGGAANGRSILQRAKAEAEAETATKSTSSRPVSFHRRKFGHRRTSPSLPDTSHPPKLYRATTSELDNASTSKLPPPPSWMTAEHPRPIYACLRNTPPLDENPNRHFIAQLEKIKEARLLALDEIGVRAYSTSIASISAYLHRITSPLEITRLPGCNEKIASLWVEWHMSVTASESSGTILAEDDPEDESDARLDPQRTIPLVREQDRDTNLGHLRVFHDIWGVGPETARRFHFNNGWKDLDDVIEFGWSSLTRVQQIGVKFHQEFKQTIPREEVEDIARTVLHHTRLVRNVDEKYWTNDVVDGRNGATTVTTAKRSGFPPSHVSDPRDFVAVIVGGYRRGKPESGDVDVILSHRDERMTQDLIIDVVHSLETAGWITHTLTLHTTTSDRDQQTLPFRNSGGGHGFDSLDKALCVWQNPHFDDAGQGQGQDEEEPKKTKKKNPNIHRRVDIIVSSWRTIGCAVLGWSGGTTFQRDIRRWAKRERGWKFDSSGVRDRANGVALDLESPGGGSYNNDEDNDDCDDADDNGDGWEDREKRLMKRLGIGWRPARERCTG